MEFIPHAYQAYAIDWILSTPRCGLYLPMGLGKTAPTLFAIEQLMHDYFEIHKVLVIAPPKVALSTWSDEIDKWSMLNLKYSRIVGSNKQKRISAIHEDSDIYMVNNENLVWLIDYLTENKIPWPFDMVVVDEWSKYKSWSTKGFKSLKKVMPLTKRFVGLTGTPSPNGYMDLWSQIYLLDRGERLGRTITSYRSNYFIAGRKNRAGVVFDYQLREGSKTLIDEKLKDVCFSLKREDWLDIPPRTDLYVKIDLEPKVLKKYLRFEKDKLLEIEEDNAIVGASAGVLANKLLQYANGAIYDELKNTVELHQSKLDALDEIIEQANGEPILVFYNFQHDYDRIIERYPYAQKLNTDEDLKKWNAKKIKLLVCHPASVGHGLNMQSGGNIVVWFGLTYSLELYLQANARLHRQGQKEKVFIYHLISKGTVDEKVVDILKSKNATQQSLLEALMAKIRGRHK